MIRQLMREQLRSQRSYLIWTTALLAIAIGLTSYSALVSTQLDAVSDHVNASYGMDGEWRTLVNVSNDEDPYGDGSLTMARGDLEALMAEADAEGAGMTVRADTTLLIVPTGASADAHRDRTWYTASTLTGAVDWSGLLADGAAPGAGEVAIDATWAAENDVAIGDTVSAGRFGFDADGGEAGFTVAADLTVSGLLRTSVTGTYSVWMPPALIGWDTALNLDLESFAAQGYETEFWTVLADLSAHQETPTLTALNADRQWTSYSTGENASAQYLLLASGVMVLGLIGMAFAVGRARAQSRTGWVATARVLGARRSAIVGATLLETLAVGLAAGLIGVGGAYGLLAIQWSALTSANPDALIPPSVAVPLWLAAGLIGVALLIAVIMGAIPAFWAARVEPATALKPSTPIEQATVSRTVPFWPVVALWALSAGLLYVLIHAPSDTSWGATAIEVASTSAVGPLATAAAAITSVAVLIETTRRIVRAVARRLERSPRPWAMTAGAALSGRPGLASAPAAVLALATTAIVAWVSSMVLWEWSAQWEYAPITVVRAQFAGPFSFPTGAYADYSEMLTITALVGGLLVLVALAAFLVGRQATRDEAAAHTALGLDARAARLAAALQFGLPLTLGVGLGTVAGTLGAALTYSIPISTYDEVADATTTADAGTGWAFANLTHVTIPVLVMLAALVIAIAVGAAVAALTARTSTRVLEGARP
ncbi:ABC transporter permease [Demequina salsinemoris]|uniref:ABC transporter permease n=1 Tax=Demequina salsinemoris TaxID=577470 RepID=UPI0007847C34|nr:ABC transporter permease [Demequina salsinemoris]